MTALLRRLRFWFTYHKARLEIRYLVWRYGVDAIVAAVRADNERRRLELHDSDRKDSDRDQHTWES